MQASQDIKCQIKTEIEKRAATPGDAPKSFDINLASGHPVLKLLTSAVNNDQVIPELKATGNNIDFVVSKCTVY